MYYIVIIVDEFADLMMTSGKEVEVAVARLAQKARAAGIHIMLATQRPSVDVLTGVIKSNFPTRMSCRLMSGIDSRTVLDSIGAENLLGMGDMLYRPNGSQDLIRVHGAYVDEREIEKIVEFLKKQRPAQYDERILAPPASNDDGREEEPTDECYEEAVQCVIDAGFASISMLQRHLRVGYNRAARMVDAMEREGVIGPSTGGSARREVLVGQLFKN
jgi:S-DNA-T family DNA segregation ATPase FtsK/SpoIIIE